MNGPGKQRRRGFGLLGGLLLADDGPLKLVMLPTSLPNTASEKFLSGRTS